MTPSEVVAARAELEMTVSACAEELGVSSVDVAKWESGAAPIPRDTEQMLSWLVAMRRRERAFDAAKLPECAWRIEQTTRDTLAPAKTSSELGVEVDKWNAHVANCVTCQAIEEYIDTHLGPEPQLPMPRPLRLLLALIAPAMALPSWARPAAGWAALAGGLFTTRWAFDALAWAVVRSNNPPMSIGRGLKGLLAFMLAGATLGLLWGIGGALVRRFRSQDAS
jgi:hypothetical protein